MTENIDPKRVSTQLYLVEKIVDKRIRRQRIEYLVKWVSYPEEDNSWEPLDNLIDECHHLIREFEKLDNNFDSEEELTVSDTNRDLICGQIKAIESTQPMTQPMTQPIIDCNSETTEIGNTSDAEDLETDVESITTQIEDLMTENKDNSEDISSSQQIKLKTITKGDKSCQSDDNFTTGRGLQINRCMSEAVYSGFVDGLKPQQIMAASFDGKDIYFWMEWTNTHISVVLAKEANIICPQIVIKWYENCTHFV